MGSRRRRLVVGGLLVVALGAGAAIWVTSSGSRTPAVAITRQQAVAIARSYEAGEGVLTKVSARLLSRGGTRDWYVTRDWCIPSRTHGHSERDYVTVDAASGRVVALNQSLAFPARCSTG